MQNPVSAAHFKKSYTPSTATFGDHISSGVSKVEEIGKRCLEILVTTLVMIKDNPNTLVKAFKVVIYSIIGARHYRHDPTLAAPLTNQLGRTINLIDTFGIFGDVNFFFSGEYESLNVRGEPKYNLPEKIGNGLFVAADIGGVALWLEELDLYRIGTVSTTGTGAAITLTLSQVLTGISAVAFAFLGVGAIQKLVHEYSKKISNPAEVRQAWIDLAWSVAEVTSKVFLLVGLTHIAFYGTLGLLVLGTTAALLGIVSFVHNRMYARVIGLEHIPV